MFGGNVNPAHKGTVRDSTKGAGNGEPEPEARGIAEGGGDGFHHHEVHEDESGAHSVHTHPDGHEDHEDHASFEEGLLHAHETYGEEDLGRDRDKDEHMEHSENMDEGPDFAAEYSR